MKGLYLGAAIFFAALAVTAEVQAVRASVEARLALMHAQEAISVAEDAVKSAEQWQAIALGLRDQAEAESRRDADDLDVCVSMLSSEQRQSLTRQ